MQSEDLGIVTFMDQKAGNSVGNTSGSMVFSTMDATPDTSIADFFKRPVKINSYTWLESDNVSVKQTILPWKLWLNDTYVKKKMDNYSWFRGDLKIKVVISASPFYYGKTMICYAPCSYVSNKTDTIVADAGTRYLIPYSQRKHLDVIPRNSEAGYMTLPFIWHHNMINVQNAATFDEMGKLDYVIYADLQSANGITGTGVTVTTYAWCENTVLSGASVGFSMQCEELDEYELQVLMLDEYGDGCISKPASYVASAASYFEKIPIIGPFATATRIGASAIGGIAKLFGFTNVPVIADVVPQQPNFVPNMATAEIGFPIQKLSLDPKNELSIDPRIVGEDDGKDAMVISSLGKVESYLCTADWTTSNAENDVLFYARVNPRMYDNDGATQAKLYMTPMCWLSNCFNNWRGDLVYKIEVISSMYHKGRLRISYDPSGDATYNLQTVTSSTNVVHTVIMDIGDTQTLYVRIPYQSRQQFLQLRSSLAAADEGWGVNATGTFAADRSNDNGVLTVRVLNLLTAPVASSTVRVLISCYCENLELANPTELTSNSQYLSLFEPQSEEVIDTAIKSEVLGEVSMPADNQYTVYFGENVLSLRQLMRRCEYVGSKYLSAGTASNVNAFYITSYRIPASPGFDPNGPDLANEIVAASTAPYNFTKLTYLTYITPAFLCNRGSINWTYTGLKNFTDSPTIMVNRDNVGGGAIAYGSYTITETTKSQFARAVAATRESGAAGMSIALTALNGALNFVAPNYSAAKFAYSNASAGSLGLSKDGSLYDKVNIRLTTYDVANPIAVDMFAAAGVDFSLFYFYNVPTYYIYSTYPTGA